MTADSLLFVPSQEDVNSILHSGKPAEIKAEDQDDISWVFPEVDPVPHPIPWPVVPLELLAAEDDILGD